MSALQTGPELRKPASNSKSESDPNITLLSEELLDELRLNLILRGGEVYSRTDAEFVPRTTIFNGNVVTPAKVVVLPTTVADVSFLLKFCVKHGLSPSIKAGGYGTAGWSINGDVVIDLSKLNDIGIEVPSPIGGFTGLRNTPFTSGKGKEKEKVLNLTDNVSDPSDLMEEAETSISTSKRRRSPEPPANERFEPSTGLPRDPLVAKFLNVAEIPRPAIRRRLNLPKGEEPEDDVDVMNVMDVDARLRQSSSSGGSSIPSENSGSGSGSDTPSHSKDSSTAATSPSEIYPDSPKGKSDDSGLVDIIDSVITTSGRGETESTPRAQISSLPSGEDIIESGSFSVRSNDPFGYLSSAKPISNVVSSSSSFQHRSFEQTDFHSSLARPAAQANTSSIPLSIPSPNMLNSSPRREPGSYPDRPSVPSLLSSVAVPHFQNAYVTFGAGVKQKEIDLFTSSNPFPASSPDGSFSRIPYHIPLAAHPVGSSVMLLGGFGFLSRLHGLSIDNLVEVEMVLADGSIIYVSEKEHADLWWAIRGAGPAFGVITRYKAIAHPVPVVFAGNLIYNFHASTAASLIKHFRDCVKGAPPELYANVLLTAGPAGKGSLVVVQLCFVGTQQKGKEYLHAIESWNGEKCLLNEVSEKSFLAQQDSVAQILRGQPGRQWFIRSALITSLPDDIIHKTVNEFANTPVGCTWLFELAGGAVTSFLDTCLPKIQREANFTIAAFHQWEMDDDDPLCVTTAEDWIYSTLAPVSTGGPIPAFLGRHEDADRIKACYGDNWKRLCEVKKRYDPNGIFRNTLWPLDSDGNDIESLKREPPSPIIVPHNLE